MASEDPDVDQQLQDLQQRAGDLIPLCQFASSSRLYGELRRRGRQEQRAQAYVMGTFFQMDQAQYLFEFQRMRERAVELIALLEDEEQLRKIQSDFPREQYDFLVHSMSSCAYENLAEATGQLEGYNSDGMHACIADGLQICRRTGKTGCVSCFREYACDVYLAADDPDIAAHQCRLVTEQTANWSDRGDRRWLATGRLAWLEALQGRFEPALELIERALELTDAESVSLKFEARIRTLLLRDTLRIAAGLDSAIAADPAFAQMPAAGESLVFEQALDLNSALLAARAEDWNTATQLLTQWDQRLQKCGGTHLWMETRLRLIAMKRLSGQERQAASLEKQLEQRARTANDYLTLRRLQHLQDADRPSILAIAAKVASPAFQGSHESLKSHGNGGIHASDGIARTSLDGAPAVADPPPVSEHLAALRVRMTDLMQEPSDEKFERLRTDILQLTPADAASHEDAAGFLHLFGYLIGSGEDGEAVWKWANAIAANHRQRAVVLSLLGTLGDGLRSSSNEALGEKITAERTEQLFRKSLELDATKPRNFMRAGDHFSSAGNSGDAERCFARAFRLDRSDSMIVRRLADLYASSDRPRDALHALDLSLREGCRDSQVAFDAAMQAFRLQQYESTLTYLDRFEETGGEQLWINYYRAVSHFELGAHDTAFDCIEAERRVAEADGWHLQLMRGVILAERGDRTRALSELQSVAVTPLSTIDNLSARGIMELLQRMARSAQVVLHDEPLTAATVRRLLRSGLMPEGWFQMQRDDSATEPVEQVQLHRCLVLQPLDESWASDPDRLEDQADWTSYLTEWGVLAESEEQAAETVLMWQGRIHELPATIQEMLVSEESYTDVPGVVWQGGRYAANGDPDAALTFDDIEED